MRVNGTVVVGLAYPPAWDRRGEEAIARDVSALAAVSPRVEVVRCRLDRRGDEREAALASRVDVAVALSLPPDVTRIAPRLRWVQAMGAGVGQLLSAGLGSGGIRLTTASGVNAVSVAEFAFARVLGHVKRFDELTRLQAERRWEACYGAQLSGTTLGVVGLGAIGTEIAKRARAFDMRVVGLRRRSDRPAPCVDRLYGPEGLHVLLAECDVVVAALPETTETTDLMDDRAFAAMRPGAFFCNVGRGSSVVEEALVAALRSGRLGGAALDVVRSEPLPVDSPLWDAPGLVLSPHCATADGAHFTGLFQLLRENLGRFLADLPLINEVDTALGY